MFDELKAWADKWGIPYVERPANEKWVENVLIFDSITYYPAEFHYDPKSGNYDWYGGD